jgi:hypothetical protein
MGTRPEYEPSNIFEVLMRRQGWRITSVAPESGGRDVIQWRPKFSKLVTQNQTSFFEAFGQDTVRKVIRSVLLGPQETEVLAGICPNQTRLEEILTYLQAGSIVERSGDVWFRGPSCGRAENIGPTVEWYVA